MLVSHVIAAAIQMVRDPRIGRMLNSALVGQVVALEHESWSKTDSLNQDRRQTNVHLPCTTLLTQRNLTCIIHPTANPALREQQSPELRYRCRSLRNHLPPLNLTGLCLNVAQLG